MLAKTDREPPLTKLVSNVILSIKMINILNILKYY